MTNSSVFVMAREIVDAHHRRGNGNGTVEVTPVLMGGGKAELGIFKALCALVDGTFLDSLEDDYAGPIAGAVVDAPLDAAIQLAFQVSTGPRPRELEIVDIGGTARDVVFDGVVDVASASGGERAALQLARALLRPELREKSLAVVVYRENDMDRVIQAGAWELAFQQIPGMHLGNLRSLIVVVIPKDGWISSDIHCKPETGFVHALLGEDYLRRNSATVFRARVNKIATSPTPPVFFLGAGFSASSGIPLGNVLRDKSIQRLLGPASAGLPSEELARQFRLLIAGSEEGPELTQSDEDFARLLTFERVIRKEALTFSDLPTLQLVKSFNDAAIAAQGISVKSLQSLISKGMRLVIVTVNLDTLVENGIEDRVKVFATEADFASAKTYIGRYLSGAETKVPVLKVHGSITNFASCVVNDDSTRLGVGRNKNRALMSLLGKHSATRQWVYVGASMRDLDLREFYRSHEFAKYIDESWVAPYLIPTVAEYEPLRLAHWRTRDAKATLQDHLVTETSDSFFHELDSQWKPRK